MKKLIGFLLAAIMVFCLVACGSETDSTQKQTEATPTEANVEITDDGNEPEVVAPAVGTSQEGSYASAAEWYAAKGLNLPENVQMLVGEEGAIDSLIIQKIGDEFMVIVLGGLGCEFFTFEDGQWKYYEKLGDGDWTEENGDLGDILYIWADKADGAVASGDSKEIAGHSCVGYNVENPYSGTIETFYVDESVGLFFDVWMGEERSYNYSELYDWDETITEFEYEAPAK